MLRYLVNGLTLFGSFLAVVAGGYFVFGLLAGSFSGPSGMTLVFLQLWALIGGLLSLTFGYLGRILDRRAKRPTAKVSLLGIIVGTVIGVSVLAIVVLS